MKKKCMAVGGTAKKSATMEEQLAALRGKVRPGYQAGGPIYQSGNSFSDQQIGGPMKGIAGAGMSGQVDNMLGSTKAMPGSIASAPQSYAGSVIPGQSGQQSVQSATNFGMPPSGVAPSATSQTISTGDYSTGPKETGFVFSDGTRRDGLTQDQAKQLESQQAMQRAQQSANATAPSAAAPLMTMAEKESSLGLNPNRTYTPGSAMDPLASGGGISQALKVANPSPSLPNVAVAQIPQIEPVGRNRQRNRGFADGGILDKFIRAVGKVLPSSNNEKYEPGIQSRASEDPARHGRAEALNPRTQTASSDTPPAGGFQEEAERRRKQMKEAMSYEAGGMVRFAGKGGPRDDRIPVKVAGQEINVSDGENAVILPAKTAANPAALYAIGGIIQATNDGRKPKMGGQRFAEGGPVRYVPDEIDMIRGRLETARAQEADRLAMVARPAAPSHPVAEALRSTTPIQDGIRVPAEPYRPNWTQPQNMPVPVSAMPRADVVPRAVDWTSSGGESPIRQARQPATYDMKQLPAPDLMAPDAARAQASRQASYAEMANTKARQATASAAADARLATAAKGISRAADVNKWAGRILTPVGAAIAAGNVADVATDPNKTGSDIATQAAREAGGWGSAYVGGALGSKAGAALGALGGPFAPVTIPAGALIGGIGGGLAGYYGSNKLMDVGGNAPASTSNGAITQLFNGGRQDPVREKHNAILAGQGTSGTVDLPITERDKQAAIANTAAAKQGITAGVANADARMQNVAANDGMTTTQMGAGFDPTKIQMADGYGMATNAAGKTIAAGPSEYVGADGKPTSRWADTQQYADAIARNERDKLRLAEMQAQRLGADPMAVQKASQGISQAVMQAPLDARVKQQQIQQGDIAAQNANELRALYEAHKAAKTPEERGAYEEAIRVRTGKDNKLQVVDLGSKTVDDGMGGTKVVPLGQAVIDANTKKRIPLEQGGAPQTNQQAEGIKAQLAAGKISREKAIEELRKIGFQ